MEKSSLLAIVKAISQVLPQEASIAIADKAQFIYYQPSKVIDLHIKPGDSVQEGSLTLKALQDRKKVAEYLAHNPFGMPYYAMSSPIIEDGDDAEGCVTTIFPPFYSNQAPKLPRDNMLMGKLDSLWVPIALQNIFFIASDKGKTFLYTNNGVYLNKFCLLELDSMLPKDQFIRCHRAYIVNVNSILEIYPDFHSTFLLVMKDSNRSRVPVSQKYANMFRRLMGF